MPKDNYQKRLKTEMKMYFITMNTEIVCRSGVIVVWYKNSRPIYKGFLKPVEDILFYVTST